MITLANPIMCYGEASMDLKDEDAWKQIWHGEANGGDFGEDNEVGGNDVGDDVDGDDKEVVTHIAAQRSCQCH